MKFTSAKGIFTGLIVWGVVLLLVALSFWEVYEDGQLNKIYLHVINLLIISFLAWIWFGTNYEIRNEILYYKAGPIKGSIPVSSIKKVSPSKTMWSGLKIALATKGIIVQYNKWDDIYISPENNETFIAALLAVNNKIEVSE